MKRTRCLVVLMALIMALAMVACGSEQSNKLEENTSSHSDRDDDENEVEVEDPESDEKPEVTKPEDPKPDNDEKPERPEPDPEPVVQEGPNVIGGVDFNPWVENGDPSLYDLMAELPYDGLRWIVTAWESDSKEVVTSLADGDSFEMDGTIDEYGFSLFAPQVIMKVKINESPFDVRVAEDFIYGNICGFYVDSDDAVNESIPVDITVFYEDGSTESIAITLTRS